MNRTAFAVALDSYLKLAMKVGVSFDSVRREVEFRGRTGVLYFLSTLASADQVMAVVESLVWNRRLRSTAEEIYVGPTSRETDYATILKLVLSGVSCLILDDLDEAIMIETREYPNRSISEPTTEKSIRGSKDGFNESINANLGLLRRRVRDKALTIELFTVGSRSKTDVCLVFLDDKVDPAVRAELEDRLKNLDVESLVMSDRALEEKIIGRPLSPFPKARYTERPDIAAIELYHGKALLMVDTSASVIIAPTSLFDHLHHVEEYREAPVAGSFLRIIRDLAILLSVFLLPLWFALITETDVNNYFFLRPSKETEIPILVQILLAELFMEMVRLAIVHTPSELTSAISMVSAIILGSVSIELEIFLPEILVYVSFETIASFATPSYELSTANRLVKYGLLLLTAALGRSGFLLGTIGLFVYLSGVRTLGRPYLYPLVPFDPAQARTLLWRRSGKDRRVL